MITYFDTSVLVAYYTVEDRSEEANSIVGAAELPVISDLGIAELNITIARKRREGYLTAAAATAVYALFDQHLRDVFVRVAIDGKHAEATRGLPERLAGGCDATENREGRRSPTVRKGGKQTFGW